jgi:hypothetical protein
MRRPALTMLALILVPVFLFYFETSHGLSNSNSLSSLSGWVPLSIALLATATVLLLLRLVSWLTSKNNHC